MMRFKVRMEKFAKWWRHTLEAYFKCIVVTPFLGSGNQTQLFRWRDSEKYFQF